MSVQTSLRSEHTFPRVMEWGWGGESIASGNKTTEGGQMNDGLGVFFTTVVQL